MEVVQCRAQALSQFWGALLDQFSGLWEKLSPLSPGFLKT